MILNLKPFINRKYAMGKYLISRFSLLPIVYCLLLLVVFSGCSVSKTSFTPSKKYSPEQLQKDYSIFRGALEESHPGIYWYTTKEKMDNYFSWGEKQLHDSLNEEEFRKALSYVVAKINCGHTAVKSSRAFSKYRDTTITKVFPLGLKLWPGNNPLEDDTVAIAANLIRKDTILKRGVVIKKINGLPVSSLIDTFSQFISSDGYNLTHKYQSLSNRGGFGSAYTAVFGIKENYFIDYVDSTGIEKTTSISAYNPKTDSINRNAIARFEKTSRSERKKQIRNASRNFKIDTLNKTGLMELGSFGNHLGLGSFFKSSFKKLRRSGASSLVIDVRGNGGGSVSNSTLLTKFIADKKFKVADSLYANSRKSHYKKYIQNRFSNSIFMLFFTAKKKDGKYHFGYYERHYFNPKRKNHFDGKVYILTGGNSFSATTIFAQALRDQSNVILVGEETGGGAYGNTAWLIPDVTLPETGVRFRLPLFRMVVNKNIPKNGRGVQPEVEVKPTVDAIRRGVDFKMDKVMELIRADQKFQ
jgi:C-terminal processing protease CtpA/Prc